MVRYDFSGRTAIITGGAGGFGRAIAARLHVSGASIALWNRDAAGVAAAAQLRLSFVNGWPGPLYASLQNLT